MNEFDCLHMKMQIKQQQSLYIDIRKQEINYVHKSNQFENLESL